MPEGLGVVGAIPGLDPKTHHHHHHHQHHAADFVLEAVAVCWMSMILISLIPMPPRPQDCAKIAFQMQDSALESVVVASDE